MQDTPIPSSIALRCNIAFLREEEGTVIIAAEAEDPPVDEALSFILQKPYRFEALASAEIKELHREQYYQHQVSEPRTSFIVEHAVPKHIDIFHHIVQSAINLKSSDIHLESTLQGLCVRFRVHGELQIFDNYAADLATLITSHIKILAHLSMDQQYVAQDGKFHYVLHDEGYNLRTSVIPSVHGESIVLRIIKQDPLLLGLNDLGLELEQRQLVERMVLAENGFIIVSGPTGSGKTTTLYAIIDFLKSHNLKIITLEDPIEMPIEGVNQIPINENKTYEEGLKGILRQAPDVIVFGEIRDARVANIALQAALTGHLVLTSIHANDPSEVLTRLKEMGLADDSIHASLRLIIAQKLSMYASGNARVGRFELNSYNA